ncbi:MAG: hypothetical protein JO287_09915 [Pseudonocardiales bacterium]|nr:hypothetical protein [Pseudonocardiales bacterium]
MTPVGDRYQEQSWGERLRAWRQGVKRWSRAEFRDEVEAASYRIGESRGQRLDERLIARWETGVVARPQAVYCRILAHMGAPLPSPIEPTVPLSNVDVAETWGCRANLQVLCVEMENGMKRRMYLAQSGLTLASLANPWLLDPVDRVVDSIDGRRIGHATVTDIESITAARRRMDDTLGGGSLLSAVREDLRVSISLLTRSSYSTEVGRRLYSATAEQARLASWLCFDTGRHGLAQHYTQLALRAAHSAEDRQVGANVLGFAAFQAGFRGDGVAAEALSRTALAGGRGALTPAVEGAMHARLGMGRARLGDLSGAAASFDTAEGLLTSADREAEPDWIYWFTVADLHGIAGESYMFAHEPGIAIEHLHQAIDGYGEEFARDRAMWLGAMATAHVLNGDLDEGRHTAEGALEILSGDLSSGRVVEVLTEFCGVLRTHNTRDAADFEERLAAYTREQPEA